MSPTPKGGMFIMALSTVGISLIAGGIGFIIGRLSIRLLSREYLTKLHEKRYPFELVILPTDNPPFSRKANGCAVTKRFRTRGARAKYVADMGYCEVDDSKDPSILRVVIGEPINPRLTR